MKTRRLAAAGSALAATLALGALTSAPALARRAASSWEREQLSAAAQIPFRCVEAAVSTADRRYALVSFTERRDRAHCRLVASNGVYVFRRACRAYWRQVFAGSDASCPLPFPARVAQDLRVPCY